MVLDGNTAIYEAVQKRNSLSLSAIVANLSNRQGKIIDEHKRILRFSALSFAYRSYRDRINFSNVLPNSTSSKMIRFIAVGDQHIDWQDPVAQSLTAADYSVLCRDINQYDDVTFAYQHSACFAKFFLERNLKYGDVKSVLSSYLELENAKNSHAFNIATISDIQNTMRVVIRKLWPITGSYVPHTIYRLCDPEEEFSKDTYEIASKESRAVLLDPVFDFVIVLRAINGYADVGKFADNDYISQIISKDKTLREKFSFFIEGKYQAALSVEYKGRNSFNRIYAYTINIYCMMRIGASSKRLFTEISKLYELDKQAILFLDWGSLAIYIKKYSVGFGSLSIFVSILMTEPTIARRFPIQIGMKFGSGRANRQIFDRASELFRTGKAQKITTFMRSFLDLKGQTRKFVFIYMADRAMSDRLYAIFAASTKRDPKHDEKIISQTRIDILNYICDHQSYDIEVFMKFRDEETNLLRGLHFKEMYGQGRVHLDLFSLQLETEEIIYGEFNVGALRGKKKNILASDVRFINHFSAILASRLVDNALLQSDYSVNAVLSNNLRHGVIEPKILSALDSACRAENDSQQIDSIKASVSQSVKKYMSDWLTLTENGPTILQLKREIQEIIKERLQTDKIYDEADFAEVVIHCVKKTLESVVQQASFAFKTQCEAEVKKIISDHFLLVQLGIALNERVTSKMEHAFTEVGSWLAIADLRSTMTSFSIEDIAHFEVDLFITDTNSRKLSKIAVEQRSKLTNLYEKKNLVLGVEYFEPIYTIIHNLISNAAKYSGNKHRTTVRMRIRSTGDQLIFQLKNSISPQIGAETIKANHRSAREAAKATGEQGAFKEGGSGYKKIKRICAREFGGCIINIPPSSSVERMFTVEVAIPYDEEAVI